MVERGKNRREKREVDRISEIEVSGETREGHDTNIFQKKTIHSSKTTSLFSYRFSFYRNRRMEVTARRRVVTVIPAWVDRLSMTCTFQENLMSV